MKFTAHNVATAEGGRTIEGEPLLNEQGFCQAPLRTLNAIWSPEQRGNVRIVDLGCLEGGYAVEFARQGYQSLGIEVRKANVEKCEWLAENLKLPNLKFAQDDVRNAEKHGPFEAVFCSGLLYHLDEPTAFIKMLGKITSTVLILQTHYALGDLDDAEKGKQTLYDKVAPMLPERVRQKIAQKVLSPAEVNYKLSGLVKHEGKWGRWYGDYAPSASKEQVEEDLWASYGNPRSFWLHKKELLQVIREAGFDLIYEQYDFLDDISKNRYIEEYDRGLFVGLKTRALPVK
ncbi:MAG: methyltransferase domain-containing protein [Planctomycetales bacterium]